MSTSTPSASQSRPPATWEAGGGRLAHLSTALTAIAAIALAVSARLRPFHNPDVLWQIRTGDAILAQRARVHVDLFSAFFRGRPILDHEPAFEVLVALVDRSGGLVALWWINLALASVAVAVAAVAARRLLPSVPARLIAAALIIGAVAARLELRAEAVSLTAIAIAHAIRRRELRPEAIGFRRLSPIAVAMIGAPFHGLALLVAVVPLAHAAEQTLTLLRVRAFRAGAARAIAIDVLIAALCVLGAELTAPGMLANFLGSARAPAFVEHIIEGYSPLRYAARTSDPRPLFAIALGPLAAIGLALRLRRARKEGAQETIRLADVALILALSLPGLRYVRFVALAPLATLPWTIAGIGCLLDPLLRRIRPFVALGVALTACAGSAYLSTDDLGDGVVIGFDWSRQPVEVVAWLKAHRPDGRLFHPYNFGAYLIYAGYPPAGVVIDPRAITVYPDEYAATYYAAIADPKRFEAWARQAHFDTVVLQQHHASSAALRDYLDESPSWQVVYVDDIAVVYVAM